MLTRIKQWLCDHRYDLADLSKRDARGMVECTCYKCGKVDCAEYGLALPGIFDRNSDRAHGGLAARVADAYCRAAGVEPKQ